MASIDIKVRGLSELQKFLDEFPVKVERNIMRGALRAGIKQIKELAYSYAPVGLPNAENVSLYGGYVGALRDSIRISTRGQKSGQPLVRLIAGGKNKKTGADVYYAHMIEFGTRPHIIKTKKQSLIINGYFAGKEVQHPGINPRPFMRPALDSGASVAIVTAAEYIKKRLATKHGLNTADISIGEE